VPILHVTTPSPPNGMALVITISNQQLLFNKLGNVCRHYTTCSPKMLNHEEFKGDILHNTCFLHILARELNK
jgi:putative component of membrane protein insertase Oxa1/YidC/SpoIIIJ protein YidD